MRSFDAALSVAVGIVRGMTETTNLGVPRIAALTSHRSSQMQVPVLQSLAQTPAFRAFAETSQAIASKAAEIQKRMAIGIEQELSERSDLASDQLLHMPRAVRRRAAGELKSVAEELVNRRAESFVVLEALDAMLISNTDRAKYWLGCAERFDNDADSRRLIHLLRGLLQRITELLQRIIIAAANLADTAKETQRTESVVRMRQPKRPPLLQRLQSYMADAQLGTVARSALCA